jgi:hypothetical protein
MNRQRQWQVKKMHQGLCPQCGEPCLETSVLCHPCLLKARKRHREAYVPKKKRKRKVKPGHHRKYNTKPLPEGAVPAHVFRTQLYDFLKRGGAFDLYRKAEQTALIIIIPYPNNTTEAQHEPA